MSRQIDKDYIDSFWRSRAAHPDPRIATHYKHDEALDHDLKFIRDFVTSDSTVLDLGCGACAILNVLADECQYIVGVEKASGLIRHCRRDLPSKTQYVVSDILEYQPDRLFDVVIIFGVVNFITAAESVVLYARIFSMLKAGGRLIVKHACGVHEEVVVDTHSEVIGSRYNARYPKLEDEVQRLRTNYDVKVVDIYPPAINKWENTHFYAFVAAKR
jgi:cyclopropane fatty-acyl-phospholipid synthase-like methyltransferase